jgi:hypothetical protein
VEQDSVFNVFVSDHRGPDSEQLPMDIRDAREDTAPLEGSRDRSDPDSVTNDYDAAEAERRERLARKSEAPPRRR